MTINEKVKESIDSKGMRYKFVANGTGIDETTFSKIIKGKRKIRADEFLNICDFIGENPNDFMERSHG